MSLTQRQDCDMCWAHLCRHAPNHDVHDEPLSTEFFQMIIFNSYQRFCRVLQKHQSLYDQHELTNARFYIRIPSTSHEHAEPAEEEHNRARCMLFFPSNLHYVVVKMGLMGPEVNTKSQNIKKYHSKCEEVVVGRHSGFRGSSQAGNQSLPPLSVSVFVVWFLWNNLIKVAGWLNSERKLGYVCLSFPLKSFSHPATLLPGVTAVFIIFSLFERRERVRGKKCHYLITFTIILVAVRK